MKTDDKFHNALPFMGTSSHYIFIIIIATYLIVYSPLSESRIIRFVQYQRRENEWQVTIDLSKSTTQ
jgi:hypothetical protein